ncbi:uncharacterized protein ACR2FA_012858 [Aphomia sociella]
MAYYKDIVEENGELKCTLCMIVMPDNKNCIQEHIKSDNHKDRTVQRLLVRNSMEFNNNVLKCLICNENSIQMLNGGEHINSTGHQNLLRTIKEIVEMDGAFLVLPDNIGDDMVNCLICDHTILFKSYDIEEHIKSIEHRRARSIAVQPLNGIVSVEDSDCDLWCKICKTYFDNYIEAIFQHVDKNKDHVTELRKILKLIEGQNISIEQYLIDPKQDKARCDKCETEVPCNLDLERHIKGAKHRA